jgi:predicted  nucleic acid-binding Zn-ribbon protein
LVVAIFVALGALVTAAVYQAGPLDRARTLTVAAEQRAARAAKSVEDRDRRISVLEERLTQETRSHSKTQSNLQSTAQRAREAQETIGQQNRILLEQERDIYVLRTCLRGIAEALDRVRARDRDGAVGAIAGVERECRAADRLMYP